MAARLGAADHQGTHANSHDVSHFLRLHGQNTELELDDSATVTLWGVATCAMAASTKYVLPL